jgi:hypothetical protein
VADEGGEGFLLGLLGLLLLGGPLQDCLVPRLRRHLRRCVRWWQKCTAWG